MLFYRTVPSRSYEFHVHADSRQQGRGQKGLQAKDRVTLVLCTNATGSHKIASLMIGTSKRPRCFRGETIPLEYAQQKSAWMDRTVYRHWWTNVFLPSVRSKTSEPVALILDIFSGHDMDLVDPIGQVKVFCLPPNLTSIYQPLDQGIISAVKCSYKQNCLVKMVKKFDEIKENGRDVGLEKINLLEAAKFFSNCWNELKPSAIAGCWSHSSCLDLELIKELTAEHRDYSNVREKTVNDICSMLSNFNLDSK